MTSTIRGRIWLVLVTMLLATGWALMIASPHRTGNASFLDPIEAALVNLRLATFGTTPTNAPVVIVAINDEMMAKANPLGQGRNTLARLIDAIAEQGAKVVALDILLSDAHDPEHDRDLARALRQVPSVVAAAGAIAPDTDTDTLPRLSQVLRPLPRIMDSTSIGIVNISTDQSGVPRHVPVVFLSQDGLQPSLSAQATSMFLDKPLQLSKDGLTLGDRTIALDLGFQMPLRLLGKGGTVPTVAALDVMENKTHTNLSGKLVVVGVTATGLGDRFPSPFDPALPGVEVMASAMAQMLGGDSLRRDIRIRQIDMLTSSTLAAICAGIAVSLPLTIGLSLGFAVLLVWIGLIWMAFASGIWMSAALPLFAIGPPILAGGLARYAQERRRSLLADRAVVALKKFQSPHLANRIAEDPGFLAVPQNQDVIICFVDLSGFTQLSQELGTLRTEGLLKRFHAILADIAQDHDGIVLNFMGDGALLVFGVFSITERTADDALTSAFEMVKRTRQLGQSENLANPLSSRVGLHFGPVILSRMGGEQHQQLTVTGDSVNLCSRLLEVTKAQKATIAATFAFLEKTSASPMFPIDLSISVPIRGRTGEIDVGLWRF